MKQSKIDSNIYITIRWTAFIMSSIVSALLNLFLFQSLDPGTFKWLLISISITLELTKMSTIVSRNIFRSIYTKTQKAKIKAAQHFFLTIYLLLGVLSVLAGLGFSLVVTSRTAAIRSSEFEVLEQKMGEMSDLNDRLNNYIIASEVTLFEYPPYIQAQQTFSERETLWQNAEDQLAGAIANRSRIQAQLRTMDSEDPLWVATNNNFNLAQGEVNAFTAERNSFQASLNRSRQDILNVTAEYNSARENASVRIAELQEEFTLMVIGLNLESTTPRLALIELQAHKAALDQRLIEEKGMAYMFDVFGETIGVSPDTVKFLILLFVALLIELTVYQTSPDIHVTRRVLYFFRNFIPTDVNVDKLLKQFDAEEERFFEYEGETETVKEISQKIQKIEYEDLDEPEPPKKRRKSIVNPPVEMVDITAEEINEQIKPSELESIKQAAITNQETFKPEPYPEPVVQKKIEIIEEKVNNVEEQITKVTKNTGEWPIVPERIEPVVIDKSIPEQPAVVTDQTEEQIVVNTANKTVTVEAVRKIKRPDIGEQIDEIAPTTDNGGPVHVKVNPTSPVDTSTQDQVIYYRFGKTTAKFKDRLIMFIDELFKDVSLNKKPYTLNPLDSVISKLNMNQKTCNVFVKRLCEMRLDGSPLMYYRDDKLCTTFEKDFLINYTTEVVEPKNAST